MATYKSFPFRYQDWLTATSVRGMTKEQRSDYLDLLCYLANEGDKGLADDDSALCALLKCTVETLNVIKLRLHVENGRLFNRRLSESMVKKGRKVSTAVSKIGSAPGMGEQKNIFMSETEYNRLGSEFGFVLAEAAINFLSNYKVEKDYKSKNDNLTIRRWVIKAVQEKSVLGTGSVIQNKSLKLMSAHSEANEYLDTLYPNTNESTASK